MKVARVALTLLAATSMYASPARAETIALKVESGSITAITTTEDGWLYLNLSSESQDAFTKFTARHIGKSLTIMVGGETLSAPVLRDAILAPYIPISAPMSDQKRRQIIADLVSGKSKLEIRSED